MTAVPLPAEAPDPADALMHVELRDTTPRPGTGWRPEHGDALADGLLIGHHEAARRRRLAMFERGAKAAVEGWRLATLVREHGGDLALNRGGAIVPTWRAVPAALRDLARQHRDALATWLAIEHASAAPRELRRHARPPWGAAEALHEHHAWCVCCGLPPLGTAALWFSRHGSREWNCDTCREPPDDDRTLFAFGLASPDPDTPTDAPRAASADPEPARLES